MVYPPGDLLAEGPPLRKAVRQDPCAPGGPMKEGSDLERELSESARFLYAQSRRFHRDARHGYCHPLPADLRQDPGGDWDHYRCVFCQLSPGADAVHAYYRPAIGPTG